MKKISILLASLTLTGCASNAQQLYYETAKSISKDLTVSQSACFAAVSEIAKNADNSAKVGAIALAEKCKTQPVRIEPPKKNWFGF